MWDYATGGAVYCSPAIASNNIVYFGSDDMKAYALDASTGAKLWDYTTGGLLHGSAVVAEGLVFIGSSDLKLYAIGRKWMIPGDVDGDLDVDIFDVVKITSCYGKKLGDAGYNPNAYLDYNGVINIFDVVMCTGRYGQKYP